MREISLMMDGYETQRVIQPMERPWFDNYLTEFFTENLVPFTIPDDREFTYQMAPETIPTANDLMNRAQALRAQGQASPPPRRGGLLGWLGF